jgi:hypothetical protein
MSEAILPHFEVRNRTMDGDKDGEFSVTAPENEAEEQAMSDHFDNEDPEPTTEEVNERMGTSFEDKDEE